MEDYMSVLPYAHQIECVTKLGEATLASRLIADDMGLGKTLEALLVDSELRAERHYPGMKRNSPPYKRPTLIVAPKAVHYDAWVPAIRDLFDYWDEEALERNIEVIDPKNRAKLVARLKDKDNLPCFVIVHYEALRLVPELQDIKWFHVIADEVHRVKNRKAQQSHYLKTLPTFYKTGLSGTPADDKPQDIWSVLNWLYPKQFSSYWKFINTYCAQETQEVRGQGRSFRKIVGVNKEALPRLHNQMSSWYIRRTKATVGIDLPEKYYTTLTVDLLPNQRRAYDQMKKDMIAWIGENQDTPLAAPVVISQLVRLQQFALATVNIGRTTGKVILTDPSAKLDRLEELIEGNPNESIVLFSQSRSMVDLAVERLRGAGFTAEPYTGSVSAADRNRAVQAFQHGDVQILAGTIAAGGEGITLHRASTVVFADRAWNPTRNKQAEDRLHRIGQKNPVQVIDIVARDTVDMGRLQRIANKWEELLWLLGDKKAGLLDVVTHDAIAMFTGDNE
jgi:SNF2 family DNA or RNA helicase